MYLFKIIITFIIEFHKCMTTVVDYALRTNSLLIGFTGINAHLLMNFT